VEIHILDKIGAEKLIELNMRIGLDLAHPAWDHDAGHLGIYYFLAVYLEDEEEIAENFQSLDTDHDGFISREDAKKIPDLIRVFERFDTDHDGRLSHVDFEAYENAVYVR